MNFHEYQAKELFAEYGIPVPPGKVASTPEQAVEAARALGGEQWMVKAQIHAGGRGKAGGVKFCRSLDDVKAAAAPLTTLTPPALPRPPAWICALTTTTSLPVSVMSCLAAVTASGTVNAGMPLGTGIPYFRKSSFP